MIKLDIKIDARDIGKKLDALVRKQLPFAASQAINDSLRIARTDLQDQMRDRFSAPVPRTLNSPRMKFSTKSNLTGRIWIDDEPAKGIAPARYLAAEILGGPRHHKRFEKALQSRGIMPAGMYATPGPGAPPDANGNIPGSFLVQLLSYLQAFGEQGYRANMTDKRRRQIQKVGRSARGYKTINGVAYFASDGKGRNAHLRPGIYRKTGTHGANVMPVILFVSPPSYSVRLPFATIVAQSFQQSFNHRLRIRLDKALETAK